MSAHSNPNIITDGLVYMYDTGNGKSFKGEPTINYIHHQNAVAKDSYSAYSATSSGTYNANHPNAIIAYNAAGTQMSGYYNGGVSDATNTHHAHWQYDPILKKPVVVMNDVDAQWKAKWLSTSMGSWSSYGKGYGDTYTISWLQWVDHLSKNAKAGLYSKTTASVNGFHDGQANSASAYNTKLRTWQRVYQTYTTSSVRDLDSTYLSIYMYGMYNVRATVKVADVQFTWGSDPVQFSEAYERTSTQGLLDLTRTSAIDLSNVTFDSGSQMSFDGSDDTINTGLFNGRNPSTDPFTIEAIVKSDITSGNRMWIDATTNGSSQRFYSALIDSTSHAIGIQGSAWSDTTPGDTDWHHQVIVMDGNTAKAYNNGELASSKSYTSYTLAGGLNVGGRSGYRWLGKIPIFKLYNRALTQDEVSRNYNAFKDRFGL
jgi:hypothetical protein